MTEEDKGFLYSCLYHYREECIPQGEDPQYDKIWARLRSIMEELSKEHKCN